MRTRFGILPSCALIAVLVLPACGGGGGGGGGGPRLAAPRAVNDPTAFSTALVCAECHSNSPQAEAMRETPSTGTPSLADAPIAPYDLWGASMMANSARDPFFRAQVSAEVAANPAERAEIEAECLKCHAPMASVQAELDNAPPPGLSLLSKDSDRAQLALDGVSCAACHAAEPADDSNFGGKLEVTNPRRMYGPHAGLNPGPMATRDGLAVATGAHILESALCATCHTVVTGSGFHEQTSFLEWRNSDYTTEGTPGPEAASCVDCHAPTATALAQTISTAVARDPLGGDVRPALPRRAPFAKHTFVGGNTLVLSILRDHAGTLRPHATAAAFDEQIARTEEFLSIRTAEISIESVSFSSPSVLDVVVRVQNRTGHKLPTGFPSRRAWIRLRLRDQSGLVVFASGEHDAQGRIVGRDGLPLAFETGGPPEPHREQIVSPDQVQIYEAVMSDSNGEPTFLVLSGTGFLKDNRLLPEGFERGRDPRVDPVGVGADADYDADAEEGADRVTYRIDIPPDVTPDAVEADLLFQPLGARFAHELFGARTELVRQFRRMFEGADRTPVTLAKASASLP